MELEKAVSCMEVENVGMLGIAHRSDGPPAKPAPKQLKQGKVDTNLHWLLVNRSQLLCFEISRSKVPSK